MCVAAVPFINESHFSAVPSQFPSSQKLFLSSDAAALHLLEQTLCGSLPPSLIATCHNGVASPFTVLQNCDFVSCFS